MIDVVLDQDLLGLRDCLFDGMQLLGQIKAGTMRFHHLQDAAQMALCPLESLGDGIVMVVGIGFPCRASYPGI